MAPAARNLSSRLHLGRLIRDLTSVRSDMTSCPVAGLLLCQSLRQETSKLDPASLDRRGWPAALQLQRRFLFREVDRRASEIHAARPGKMHSVENCTSTSGCFAFSSCTEIDIRMDRWLLVEAAGEPVAGDDLRHEAPLVQRHLRTRRLHSDPSLGLSTGPVLTAHHCL